MSTAATTAVPARTGVVRHFAAARGVEVAVLQASPLLGAWLGGMADDGRWGRLVLLLLGSVAVTAHVFVFNDWAGYAADARDERRGVTGPAGHGITRAQVGQAALVLLAAGLACLALLGTGPLLLGTAIAGLGVLYSSSPRWGKGTPGAASLNHLLGGGVHFLLGWAAVRGVGGEGVLLSLFFGLVFAAGHLNQEVRDAAADRVAGVRTSAVVFGARRAYLASCTLFGAAYALLAGLAVAGVLTPVVLVCVVLAGAHAWWAREALRRGLGFETAEWMQRRYRLLFALAGVALLVS